MGVCRCDFKIGRLSWVIQGLSVNYRGPYNLLLYDLLLYDPPEGQSQRERGGRGSRGGSAVGGTKSQGMKTRKARKGKEMNSTLEASEITRSPANPLWSSDPPKLEDNELVSC